MHQLPTCQMRSCPVMAYGSLGKSVIVFAGVAVSVLPGPMSAM
jgi:hypothetical protein